MELDNFKGVQHFEFTPGGSDAIVYGANASGKTTLADAWHWILFGKDSRGRAQFDIKTLTPDGEPKHGLEHTVTAELDVGNGKHVTLRKAFKEVWTKKRGQAQRQFTGHTTQYEIDGVPVKKAEYEARIAEIANEDAFRLLTDPTHLPAQMHWENRRQLLLEVCGDVTDEDVIRSDEHLARLPDVLGDRTIDEHRRALAARRRDVNEEIERLPVRIDEVQKGKPDTPGEPRDEIEVALSAARAERERLAQAKANAEAGGAIAEKKSELRDLEGELREVERSAKEAREGNAAEARREARAAAEKVEEVDGRIRTLERDRKDQTERIEALDAELARLRTEWNTVNGWTFQVQHDHTHCPACGQELPAEQIEEAHRKASEGFNQRKANELRRITDAGQAQRTKREEAEQREADLRDALVAAREERANLATQAERLKAHADHVASTQERVPHDPPEAARIRKRMDAIQAALDALQEGATGEVQRLTEQIAEQDTRIETAQAGLAQHDQVERADKRIQELSDQERTLAQELERIEEEWHLLDSFVRAKVHLLEARVNSYFTLARFRLFRDLVNGGIEECCDVTVDGVPYDSLNHGARLNVGIDIINTLAEHYQFAPPVFVDNAESVTSILPTRGQAIKLVVTPDDTSLRVAQADAEEVPA